ncbi:hypothetical protein HDV00_008738 [Rhizophlyctis rosea]|nr:hypothetical protein HDV00_008738 [Rhizophlyctis rosea]
MAERQRVPTAACFGPRSGWYVRWSDGTSGWQHLPPTLHAKLESRLPSLPGVKQLSVSELGQWFVAFEDGSFATSGFSVDGRLREALDSGAEVTGLVFAPGGGWVLWREDGTISWERLPSTLAELLKRRGPQDAHVDRIEISKLGAWFVRFVDKECEWEGLPPRLEKFLIQQVRKEPPHVILALSPVDANAYFVSTGEATEHAHTSARLQATIEWGLMQAKERPKSVFVSAEEVDLDDDDGIPKPVPAGKAVQMEEVDLDDDDDIDGDDFSREGASSDSSHVFSDVSTSASSSSPPSTTQDERDLDEEDEHLDSFPPTPPQRNSSTTTPSSSTSHNCNSIHSRSTSLDSAAMSENDTTLAKVIAERDSLRKRVLELEAQIARMSAAAAEAANEVIARDSGRDDRSSRRQSMMSFVSASPTSPRIGRRLF